MGLEAQWSDFNPSVASSWLGTSPLALSWHIRARGARGLLIALSWEHHIGEEECKHPAAGFQRAGSRASETLSRLICCARSASCFRQLSHSLPFPFRAVAQRYCSAPRSTQIWLLFSAPLMQFGISLGEKRCRCHLPLSISHSSSVLLPWRSIPSTR